ncbi:MAG: family acetyltransferase [Gammaproteobacteria bacterium]|nr:family acetyltransferase [Gammaproteobacteria bacterium]
MLIRDATSSDLPEILGIYNDVVSTTTAIYDERVSTLEERHAWFEARRQQGLPVLVAQLNDEIAGFSSFGEWRARWGYRYTVEHSVHIRRDCRGQGFGRALIEALFPRAAQLGMHVMIAQIDSEAIASLRLHEKLGFEPVGTFRQVAHKFGRWLDLVAMQRTL